MPKQDSISDLLSPEAIQERALPSNFRYGTAIYKRGAVELIEAAPDKVQALCSTGFSSNK